MRLAYLGVFALALAVRLAIVAWTADTPLSRSPALDSRQYLVWAQWILDGRLTWPQPAVQGPAYPLLLAGLLAITGGSLKLVAAIQGAIGALSAVMTMMIAARAFDRRAAIAAGVLQALYAPLALAETSLLVEGLFVFLISLAVLAFMTQRGSARGLLVAGAAAGLAAICRSTALPLAAVFAILIALEAGARGARARRVGAYVLGVAMLTLPVAAKNAMEGGGWRLQGKGGFNFYIGNTPSGDGLASFRLGRGWDRLEGEADRAGIATVAGQDGYYTSKTLGEIANAPGRWIGLLAKKAVWSVQAEEVRDSLSYYYLASQVSWLRWLPGFGLILPLAAAGLVVACLRGAPRELIAWLVVSWITLVMLVVGYRYRLPLLPPLIVFAGGGLVAAFDALRARNVRMAGTLGAAMLVSAAAAHAWRHEPSHVFAEELTYVGDALQAERRFTEAEARYREALAADPQSAMTWKNLGVLHYNLARLDEARASHLEALRLDPDYADAWMRLAFVEGRERRYPLAAEYMRKAAAIYPRDVPIRRYLARYLFEAGDFAAAIPELEWILRETPQDAEVVSLLNMATRRLSS